MTSCATRACRSASGILPAPFSRSVGSGMRGIAMTMELYLAFLLTTIVIIIVPGPTVTLVIANSLTHGGRAGLLNVAGNQAGMTVMVGIVIVGLASLIEAMG